MAVIDPIGTELRTLRALSSGSVVAPGDEGWNDARQAWNVAADLHPAAVAFPETASDMAFAIAFARDAGLRVNVQGTGHNARPLGDMGNTLLIRTTRMTGVEIDADARTARVEAGVIWRDVSLPASDARLAPLAGSSPDVGIVGYSLGGGIGYLGRKHGIQTNSVTAIELVTADGDYIRATADDHADLFWAMRGGGGNFGAVTALEFDLYPVEQLYAGALIWPWEQGERVIKRWRDWTETLPDEVTSMARLLQLPDMEEVPEPIRGRQIAIVTAAVLGDQEMGDEIMRPLRELGPEMDFMAPMPPAGLSGLHGDPETPVPVNSNTAILDSLPDAAIDAFIEHAGPGSNSVLLMAEFRHMGGAFGRSAAHHGALDRIAGDYLAFTGGLAIDAAMDAIVEEQSDALIDALAPYGSGRNYLNFAERQVDASTGYSDDAWERLCRIRAEVDPEGVFRANHEIA